MTILGNWSKRYVILLDGMSLSKANFVKTMQKLGIDDVAGFNNRIEYTITKTDNDDSINVYENIYRFFERNGLPETYKLDESTDFYTYEKDFLWNVEICDTMFDRVELSRSNIMVRTQSKHSDGEPDWTNEDRGIGKLMGALKEVLDEKFDKDGPVDSFRVISECEQFVSPETQSLACPVPDVLDTCEHVDDEEATPDDSEYEFEAEAEAIGPGLGSLFDDK